MAGTPRLAVESLEARDLLALILDPISSLRINEGDLAQLPTTNFTHSTRGGSYMATVDWGAGGGDRPANVSPPTGPRSSMQIQFDYRFDTTGFFGPSQRAALQAAGEMAVSRLGDTLSGFQSIGIDQFTASFQNPATGALTTLPGFGVGLNEFVIFVGSRDLPDMSLGEGGPGGGSAREAFFNQASARGQPGWPQSDFAPWGGAITFDSNTNWNFDTLSSSIGNSENDFFSVAVHEIFHVLGVSPGVASFDRFVAGGVFNGPASVAAHDGGGPPPLASDNAHFREGLRDGNQETLMDPTINTGTRKLPTELDWALLDDIGWDILPAGNPGRVIASTTFSDNGMFTGRVSVVNGNDRDERTFAITVDNVAPTISTPINLSFPLNAPVDLIVPFNDPGTGDTHTAEIDWGDGTVESNATVDQGNNRVTGSHQYAAAGTYTLRIGVRDDDGGADLRTFSITINDASHGGWQNTANPLDVNVNGLIDPLDALLIINELTARVFSDPITGELSPRPANLMEFIDVTGDNLLAPLDALLVINGLGENRPQPALASTAGPRVGHPIDIPFAKLREFDRSEDRESILDRLYAHGGFNGGGTEWH